MEILQKYECGVRVPDLANMYSRSKSTISTITQIIQASLGIDSRTTCDSCSAIDS
jgi:DNA-binding NarL/FixJ family response regulator